MKTPEYGDMVNREEWLQRWFKLMQDAPSLSMLVGIIETMKYELMRNMEEHGKNKDNPTIAS